MVARPFFADREVALTDYRRQGFHLEADLWNAEACAALVTVAQQQPSHREKRYAPVMMIHREAPAFLDALKTPKIVRILEVLLGGNISGLQTQFFYGAPGTVGFSAHQDNHYVQAPGESFASVWCPLVDVDETNGGLIVYPGSHREPLLPMEPLAHPIVCASQDPNAHREAVLPPATYSPLSLRMKAGDALFFHGHLIHGSHTNRTTDRFRPALLLTYLRVGQPFRAGRFAKREEVSLAP